MDGSLVATVAHNTVPDVIAFVVGAAVILSGAVGVVIARNPVHAALCLVATLFGVAVLFVEQQANFLAAVQVIVYAGAIVVLFLFVIMFLGVDRRENLAAEPLKGQRPLALVLIVVAMAGIVSLGINAHWVPGAHSVTFPAHGPKGDVGQLGKSVFTTYLFAFEATAGLLVIAVVGAISLARRPPPGPGQLDEPEPADEWAAGPDAPADELDRAEDPDPVGPPVADTGEEPGADETGADEPGADEPGADEPTRGEPVRAAGDRRSDQEVAR
jgi:NADH-quinone oxidoreductase subunit J